MQRTGGDYSAANGRRATALFLTLLVHGLAVLLVLLQPSWLPPVRRVAHSLSTFELQPQAEPAPKAESAHKPKEVKAEPQPIPTPPPPTVQPPPPPPVLITPPIPMAAPPPPPAPEPAPAPTNVVAVTSPADGHGFNQFQEAAWERRPSAADLAPYIQGSGLAVGEGAILCRTAPGNHVRDCRIAFEKPAGSGLARVMQRASGKFRVLAPTVDGHPNIGIQILVRIQITPPAP